MSWRLEDSASVIHPVVGCSDTQNWVRADRLRGPGRAVVGGWNDRPALGPRRSLLSLVKLPECLFCLGARESVAASGRSHRPDDPVQEASVERVPAAVVRTVLLVLIARERLHHPCREHPGRPVPGETVTFTIVPARARLTGCATSRPMAPRLLSSCESAAAPESVMRPATVACRRSGVSERPRTARRCRSRPG